MPDSCYSGKLPIVLIVDDNLLFLDEVRFSLLSHKMCEVVALSDSTQVLPELKKGIYSVLFLDWIMPGLSGADLLPHITQNYPDLPVVIMTGVNDVDTAVSCIKQKAFDYITKPLDTSRLTLTLKNALKISELSTQNQQLKGYLLGGPVAKPNTFNEILTESEKMRSIFKLIETISPSRYPVFITGETGVGKELIARAVHKASGLAGNFVPLNVAAIDPQILDDTLFGHKKGAFTGAGETREGLIAKAQGGTLFLDEIGDIPADSQIKLLRLLQENEYYRLGSDVLHKSDARIVVASNKDFDKLLEEGKFREDLYHRLACHKVDIPPLRERREDILPLARHYANVAANKAGKPPVRFSSEVNFLLTRQDFPGNIRELIFMVNNAVISNTTGILTCDDFPNLGMSETGVMVKSKEFASGQFSLHALFPKFPTMEEVEKLMVRETMKITGGKQGATAELLGVCRQTIMKRMKDLDHSV